MDSEQAYQFLEKIIQKRCETGSDFKCIGIHFCENIGVQKMINDVNHHYEVLISLNRRVKHFPEIKIVRMSTPVSPSSSPFRKWSEVQKEFLQQEHSDISVFTQNVLGVPWEPKEEK